MCVCVTLTVHLIGSYQFGTLGYDGNIMVLYQHLHARLHQLEGRGGRGRWSRKG